MIFLENAKPAVAVDDSTIMESMMDVQEAVTNFNEELAVNATEYQELMMESAIEEANDIILAEADEEGKKPGVGTKVKDAAVKFFKKVIEIVNRIWQSVKTFLAKTYLKLTDSTKKIQTYNQKHAKDIAQGFVGRQVKVVGIHSLDNHAVILMNGFNIDEAKKVARGERKFGVGAFLLASRLNMSEFITTVAKIIAQLKAEAVDLQKSCKTNMDTAQDGLKKAKADKDEGEIKMARKQVSEQQAKLTAQNKEFSGMIRVCAALTSDAMKVMHAAVRANHTAEKAAK